MAKASSFADEIMVLAAKRRKGGVACWTCTTVPPKLLKEIHEARDRGAPIGAIVDWLLGRKEFPDGTVCERSVGNHFRNRHTVPA